MAIIALNRPGPRHKNKRQQQAWESKDDVHDAHDHGINPASDKPGDQPHRHPAHQSDRDNDPADEERVAGPEDQPREHVAADGVRAKHEIPTSTRLPDRRPQQGIAKLFALCVWREERCRHGKDHNRDKEVEAYDGAAILAEI
jgi:hypothetical protein